MYYGTATLKDATSEAIRDWVTNVESTHYILGSAAGPHPYPMMVSVPEAHTAAAAAAGGRQQPPAVAAARTLTNDCPTHNLFLSAAMDSAVQHCFLKFSFFG